MQFFGDRGCVEHAYLQAVQVDGIALVRRLPALVLAVLNVATRFVPDTLVDFPLHASETNHVRSRYKIPASPVAAANVPCRSAGGSASHA